MTDAPLIADARVRAEALDVTRSFIVQAPAGSGKTALLIHRLLTLLACVEAPEEVVAITFTRKAAGEMRQRVLEALELGQDDRPPENEFLRATWRFAREVLRRDRELGWQLVLAPGRLRIQTIDSLSASLCRQMPLLGGPGAQLNATEDAESLYREAARRTLAMLGEPSEWGKALAEVLVHLDNDFGAAESLMIDMLRRRDQWLPHLAGTHLDRDALEAGVRHWIEDALFQLRAKFPMELAQELMELGRFAANHVGAEKRAILALMDETELPGATHNAVEAWKGIAELLLTKDGSLRVDVDKRIGFPPPPERALRDLYGDCKKRMQSLLVAFQSHSAFFTCLAKVRSLPPAQYDEVQWRTLDALGKLLPLMVAQLHLVFNESGSIDFSGIAQAAVRALGEDAEPTDLALALDYRVKHLLVDEFQDTSRLQFALLEALTRGWQPGDGRTLFLVGDPMQSIYRFREAEVGLFLRARDAGIGAIRLTPLRLTANFRSQPLLVEWFNRAFPLVLPQEEDADTDAVTYSPVQAVRVGASDPALCVYPMAVKDEVAQAGTVLQIIRAALEEKPGTSVAVLVSSRRQLGAVLPRLRSAGIAFQAIDIEPLGERQAVQDLMALTCALLHPADRIAWLSLLRAPWCGLALADLERVAGLAPHKVGRTIWDALQDEAVTTVVTSSGARRIRRVVDALSAFVNVGRRGPLQRWVEGVWVALGGPSACSDAGELQDALAFFELLEVMEGAGEDIDFEQLHRKVNGLYARPDSATGNVVQVMTIHKAKGLEFDHVIIPGLGSKRGQDHRRLLRWMERRDRSGSTDLLLAPIGPDANFDEPLHALLKSIETERERNEVGRLLYVAVTRARERLHLIGHVGVDSSGQPKRVPISGSLLKHLWPVLAPAFAQVTPTLPAPVSEVSPRRLRRLREDWTAPPITGERIGLPTQRSAPSVTSVEFSWATEVTRKVGIAVHRMLQRFCHQGTQAWDAMTPAEQMRSIQSELVSMAVPADRVYGASSLVRQAIEQALADGRGQWILRRHREAASELRLTGVLDGEIVAVAMDRTFVDEADQRWIIDYKTSPHEGASIERFLDNERERYRGQIERYATLFRLYGEQRPIRLGLYFPLQQGWREWAFLG